MDDQATLGLAPGNNDPRFPAPVYDPHWTRDPESAVGVNPFEKGQRVCLVGTVRPELADRLGRDGTVMAWDQTHVQVDLDVGGAWWIERARVEAL